MADLVTLELVKQYLNIQDSSQDALLSMYISAASAQIQSFIGRTLGLTAYNVSLNGTGTSNIGLPQYPVTSIAGVVLGDLPVIPALTIGSYGYVFENLQGDPCPGALLQLRNGTWFQGTANVLLSYTAGYAVIPADVQLICLQYVQVIRQRAGQDFTVSSESTPMAGSVSYAPGASGLPGGNGGLPDQLASGLTRYQRVL